MMHTPRGHRQGFTLIEILIATTILTGITMMVYMSFSSVIDATNIARESAERIRYRQYIARNLNENMTAIYVDAGVSRSPYLLEGTDSDGPLGAADSITFVSSLPMPGAFALPGMMKKVTYEVVDASSEDEGTFGGLTIDEGLAGEKDQMYLQITELPLVLGEADDSFTTDYDNMDEGVRQRRVPIRSMEITYFDGTTEDWVDGWNSMEEERLPWAIRIQIYLARTEDALEEEYSSGLNMGDAPDLDLSFIVPMGAGTSEDSIFYDFNHFSTSELEQNEAGGFQL